MITECWTPQSSHRDTFFSIYLVCLKIIYHLIIINLLLFLIFSHTVPSVDSSIPVTIQPVVTGNMVDITVLVNVSNNEIICLPHK